MADLTTRSDVELWKLAVETQSEEAFHALMDRHRDPVWSVCSRMLRNSSDAEDAFQMTFLALLEHGADIRSRDFGAWLYRVAYRASLRVQANRIDDAGATDLNTIAESSMDADVFREIEQSEQSQIIEAALDSLPEKYREVLVLHYCSGIARDEIAERLGLTPQTVKARLSRGRAALRSRLMRRGLSLSLAAVLLGSQTQAAVVPSGLEANTWQLAQQWLAGEPVGLEVAQFSDSPTMEYGMKSLNGLNAKWSLVAVAGIAALFLVFEAGKANGASGTAGQQGTVFSDVNRLAAEGTRTDVPDPKEPVRAEILPASHVVAKPVQTAPAAAAPLQQPTPGAAAPVAAAPARPPMVQVTQPGGGVASVPLQQYIANREARAAGRSGLQDGTWSRDMMYGKASFIVEGRTLRVDFAGTGDASVLSGSAVGEFSVASDGTVYGLLHSVDFSAAGASEEATELALTASLLNDLPFSMRVHTDNGLMAVKSFTLGAPAMISGSEIETVGQIGMIGMYLCGTYRSPGAPQPRQVRYIPRPRQQVQYPPLYGAQPAFNYAGQPLSPFQTPSVPQGFQQPSPVQAVGVPGHGGSPMATLPPQPTEK